MQKKLIVLFMCGIVAFSAKAQGEFLKSWAVGVNAGLYGYGLQGATSLSSNIKASVGFDYMSYSYNDVFDFDAPITNIPNQNDLRGEFAGAKLSFFNAKAMIDYYPMKNGIFCFTAGFYTGNNKITADAKVLGYDKIQGQYPEIGMEEIVVKPNPDGSFDATLKLGDTFKPYFGIGLGRTIPKSRIGFKFELGVVYQGEYRFESNNISGSFVEDANNQFTSNIDFPVSKDVLKLWPMLNFTLSYRIK